MYILYAQTIHVEQRTTEKDLMPEKRTLSGIFTPLRRRGIDGTQSGNSNSTHLQDYVKVYEQFGLPYICNVLVFELLSGLQHSLFLFSVMQGLFFVHVSLRTKYTATNFKTGNGKAETMNDNHVLLLI